MISQLADLLLHGGVDKKQISNQLSVAGLINDSFRKQLTKPVFSAMVCDFLVPSRAGKRATDMIERNGPTSNLKEVQGRTGMCVAKGYAGSEAAVPSKSSNNSRQIWKLLHLLLLGQVGTSIHSPTVARRQRSPSKVCPHQHPKQAQLVITSLSAETQLHQQTAALQTRAPPREVKREVE